MTNIALELILSSLGSVYLEAEFLTSRFSLFCLPWMAIPGSGMSNIDGFRAYSVFLRQHAYTWKILLFVQLKRSKTKQKINRLPGFHLQLMYIEC